MALVAPRARAYQVYDVHAVSVVIANLADPKAHAID